MKQKKSVSVILVQWFGVFALAIGFTRALLTPITNYVINFAGGMVNYLRYNSLEKAFDYLPHYLSYLEYMFTGEYLLSKFFSALLGLLGLLPLVLFLVYLFFLYRNHRHNVLLPLAFLLAAGISVLVLNLSGYAAYEAFAQYTKIYGNLLTGVARYFTFFPGTITSLVNSALRIGICLVLAVDGFARFRLRWASAFWLSFYILAVLLAPLFSTLLIPLCAYFLVESWNTPVYEVFNELIRAVGGLLFEAKLSDLLYHGYCLLNTLIPSLLGLLPAFTYLLFWICGAKRVKKAVPAAEIVE